MEGNYMTESEYNELAEGVFLRIEKTIDANGADIDCNLNGPVMELEFLSGSKIIINRHTINQEIWLAAKTGGYHFEYDQGQWISRRDSCELFTKLGELVALGTGEILTF